ncbi:MAG: hypothetical protein H7123_02875 [Thermoleophilia bacterium]|nr:hypothetical protein [Thermoleophilia bacterium]
MKDTTRADPMFNIPLTRVDGVDATVTLRELSGAQPVHVVLLRHLNCAFCQVHLGEIVRRRDEIGRVVVVSFADHERTLEYGLNLPRGVMLVRDEGRNLYAASTAPRGSLWAVLLRPQIIAKIAWYSTKGIMTRPPKEDGSQLGADLVFDVHGRAVLKYISQTSDDRPPVDLIIGAMHVARAGIEVRTAA